MGFCLRKLSMAKCKECGSVLSTEADACPQCGYRMQTRSVGRMLFSVVIIGFVVLMIYVTWRLIPHSVP
jgi:uncharacterized OB-fold protein